MKKTVIYLKGSGRNPDDHLLAGVAEYARQANWNLQSIPTVNSATTMRKLLKLWHADGVIVKCGLHWNRQALKALDEVPTVIVQYPPDIPLPGKVYVSNDTEATAAEAAHELLRINLSTYAYVPYSPSAGWDRGRRDGFIKILKLHGHAVNVFSGHPRSLRKFLASLPKPLGVFAANDVASFNVSAACRLEGLHVPNDVAIVGVDNVDACESAIPSLSSVIPDFRAGGRIAAEQLEMLMSKRIRNARLVKYPTLSVIRRESTRRFSRRDKEVEAAVETIRRDACNGLTAAQIVKTFSCSRRMAEIRFRATTGHSILKEIRTVRLEKAKSLLRERTMSMSAIANICGYATNAAFTTFFYNETGLTPSEFYRLPPAKVSAQLR